MKPVLRRQSWVLIFTGLLCALPLFAVGIYVYNKHQWALGRMAELEPRYARLVGLEAGRTELTEAATLARAILEQYVYPADKDASQTGNDAQQRVRDVLSAAGLQVGSSQVLPPKTEGNFDRIQITVRAEGELGPLQGALIGLSGLKPAVFVDELNVNVMGTPKAEVPQKLSMEFRLSALRVHP